MSCEYCTGEKFLVQTEKLEMLDGRPWVIGADTKIARGHYLGTKVNTGAHHSSGASIKINYCPICGEDLRYEHEK